VPDDQSSNGWARRCCGCDLLYLWHLGSDPGLRDSGPKLLRIDLRAESRKLKRSWYQAFQVRRVFRLAAYQLSRVYNSSKWFIRWKDNRETEKSVPTARLFVERVRRNGELFWPRLPLSSRQEIQLRSWTNRSLISLLASSSTEATDPELLEIPVASYGLYVTSKKVVERLSAS